jgi:hypothetical protein
MNRQIEQLKEKIEPLRHAIINHKVYEAIRDIEDLKIFMHYHVYAVWDFMSLLKTLQNNLTCTSIPWYPFGLPDTRFFINEIVVGEESDVDLDGQRKSHFEMYLDAMDQCGADTLPIQTFISSLRDTGDFKRSYEQSKTPKEAADFVDFTFKIINSHKVYLQAAIFTFGREDLIPSMFISMVEDIHQKFPNSISRFKYYLERHIEIDGDHHSHLALQMTSNLCHDNQKYWDEVELATVESLEKRLKLWDGAYYQIMEKQSIGIFHSNN